MFSSGATISLAQQLLPEVAFEKNHVSSTLSICTTGGCLCWCEERCPASSLLSLQ